MAILKKIVSSALSFNQLNYFRFFADGAQETCHLVNHQLEANRPTSVCSVINVDSPSFAFDID